MYKERFSENYYSKKTLSIDDQIIKLKSRGLIIKDQNIAHHFLSNISYYRLRAYTYPFQNNEGTAEYHHFIRKDIQFEQIIDIYTLDRELRSLVFTAIEEVEVGVRAKLVQIYSEATNNSHWYEDAQLFSNAHIYNTLHKDIIREVDRSNEDFIKHYKKKYASPCNPPAWMALEVISLGTLSRIYASLNKDATKKLVAKSFGLNDVKILENWLHAISNLRNCCAHHSRIWNRRFMIGVIFPKKTIIPFFENDKLNKIRNNKLYAYLCCISYLLNLINPNNEFPIKLNTIISRKDKLLEIDKMGFTTDWKEHSLWKR